MNLIKNNDIFLLEELIKRNFAAKYKDSVLGILWSVLKPLLIMILLTIIFSTLFSKTISNFPVYFLAGKCIFDFFSASTNLALTSIKGNKNILKKTTAPKYIFVLSSIISEFLNFIITLLILIGVMIATNAPFHLLIMPLAIIPIISVILLSLGLGLILSIIGVYYTDIRHLWSVVILMLMYASAIFYPMEIIPNPFHDIMILNPIFWAINQFRYFFIWGEIPQFIYITNSLLISMIILVLGAIIFKKYEYKIIMKL